MSNRTMALVLMFGVGVVSTGVVMAMLLWLLDGRGMSAPWLLPIVAASCQVAVLFLGRRFILPPGIAESFARSAVAIITMVLVTLAIAALTLWGVRRFVGPVPGASALLLGLWFALLWWLVQRRTAQASVIPP